MANDLEELKRKRDQAIARVQQAEARLKANTKQEDDRVKVITGAWLASEASSGRADASAVLAGLNSFLTRPSERKALLGDDGRGSEAFRRVVGIQGAVAQEGESNQFKDPDHPEFGS